MMLCSSAHYNYIKMKHPLWFLQIHHLCILFQSQKRLKQFFSQVWKEHFPFNKIKYNTNSYHTYYMPGLLLSCLHLLSHTLPITTLWDRHSCFHLQTGLLVFSKVVPAKKWQRLDENPASLNDGLLSPNSRQCGGPFSWSIMGFNVHELSLL